MKITDEMIEALRDATCGRGLAAELARKSGVAKESISRYLSGKCRDMELETWEKLCPHIRKCLSHGKITYNQRQVRGVVNQTVCGDINNAAGRPGVREALLSDPDLTPEQKKKFILEIEEAKLNNKLKIQK